MHRPPDKRRTGSLAGIVGRSAVIVFLGSVAVPGAVQGEEHCAPDDSSIPSQRFFCARTLAKDGRFNAAADVYESLSSEFPDNVDYVFGEAQARFWSGDLSRALVLAARARQLAPAYEDVWALEHHILQAAPVRDEGRLREFRRAARSHFPDARWLDVAEEKEQSTWYWESGIDREKLDNGADDWQSAYVHVGKRTPKEQSMSLTLSEHRRFSLDDVEIALAGGMKVTDHWLVDGTLRLAPRADFLPDAIITAGIGRILGDGWIVGGHFDRREYADESVDLVGIRVERYFGNFRATLHVDNARLDEASTITYRGGLDYYAPAGSRYGLTVAAGEEVEVIAPGDLLDMDVSAVALSGRHPVGNGLYVAWRLGTHRQGSLYRRDHIGLSIAGEF